jgi:hypothetical protein
MALMSYGLEGKNKAIRRQQKRLCDGFWKSRPDAIVRVGSDGKRTPATLNDLAMFKNYAVDTRANQLDVPVTVWWRGAARKLVRIADYRKFPVMGVVPVPLAERRIVGIKAA